MTPMLKETRRVRLETESVESVIRDIIKSGVEEAFHVCDLGDIVEKFKNWKCALPRVTPFYATKCNDYPVIQEIMNALGCNFDCASAAEIEKMLALGVSPDRILFANTMKQSSHIRYAASVGVRNMTFDNEIELHKIKEHFPDASLLIRIRCDDIIGPTKFACDHKTEAPALLRLARDLNMHVVGVCFHLGPNLTDPQIYRRAIGNALELFDSARSDFGFDFKLLDIGGGMPGAKGDPIDDFLRVIDAALSEYFSDPTVKIIAEPGRYFVESSGTLVTMIHSKKSIQKNPVSGQALNMYFVNDGSHGSLSVMTRYNWKMVPVPLHVYTKKSEDKTLINSTIWGPTCDGKDKVMDNVLLPELGVGDWLLFENMGAYTIPVGSTFNGFQKPKMVLLASKAIWDILK